MDGETISNLMESSTTLAIAILWIWSERKAKQEALNFYREKIEQCQKSIEQTLDRVMSKSNLT